MKFKNMVQLREWPYPELQDVPEEELNKFVFKQGRMGAAYVISKNERISRNSFYKSVGFSFSWAIIIYGMIVMTFFIGCVYATKILITFLMR